MSVEAVRYLASPVHGFFISPITNKKWSKINHLLRLDERFEIQVLYDGFCTLYLSDITFVQGTFSEYAMNFHAIKYVNIMVTKFSGI